MGKSSLARTGLVLTLVSAMVLLAGSLGHADANTGDEPSSTQPTLCFHGWVRDSGTSPYGYLAGVTVELWLSDNPLTLGTRFDSDVTDSDGHYRLSPFPFYNTYFHVVETDPPGYVSTGATHVTGEASIVNDNWIRYAVPALRYHCYFGSFYDQLEPTATPTSTPTATPTATATPQPWAFKGHVYSGIPPGPGSPLDFVIVQLWGSDDPLNAGGTLLDFQGTKPSLGYAVGYQGKYPYSFFHLIEIDPSGYVSTGAEASPGGSVVRDNWIRYNSPARGTYQFSNFWDQPEGPATPTPTATRTRTPTGNPTATATATATATRTATRPSPVQPGYLPLITNSHRTALFFDGFQDARLHPSWWWVREDPTHWSLTEQPGFLRIVTQRGSLGGANNARNVMVREAPGGDFEMTSEFLFAPSENYQSAGLLIYQDDDNYLDLSRAYCDAAPPVCVGDGIYFDLQEGGSAVGSNFAMPAPVAGSSRLRLQRWGREYVGYVWDGADWQEVGKHTVGTGFVPQQVGLTANNSTVDAPEIPADFDWFWVRD